MVVIIKSYAYFSLFVSITECDIVELRDDYRGQLPSQISPTADFDGAAIPPSIFSMATLIAMSFFGGVSAHLYAPSAHLYLPGLMADIKCTFKTESLLLS